MRRLIIDPSLVHLITTTTEHDRNNNNSDNNNNNKFSQVHQYLYGIELRNVSILYTQLVLFLHDTNCRRLWIDDEHVSIVYDVSSDDESDDVDDVGACARARHNDKDRTCLHDHHHSLPRLTELRSIVSHFPIIPSQMFHLLTEKLGRVLVVNFSYPTFERYANRMLANGSVIDNNNHNSDSSGNDDSCKTMHMAQFPARNLIELILFHATINDQQLLSIVSQQSASLSIWRLKTLRLIDCGITSQSLYHITHHCPMLEELQVEIVPTSFDTDSEFSDDGDDDGNDREQNGDGGDRDYCPLHHLRSLTLHGFSKSVIQCFLSTVVRKPLVELDILGFDQELDIGTVLHQNDHFMHLHKLTTNDTILSKTTILSLVTPRLKCLKLFDMRIDSQFLSRLECVETLEYEECVFESDEILMQSCSLPHVRELFIYSCVTDESSIEEPLLGGSTSVLLSSHCGDQCVHSLETLQISVNEYDAMCDRVVDIVEVAPRLKHLALDSPSSSGTETADLLLQLSWQPLPQDMCLRYTLYIHDSNISLCKLHIQSIDMFVAGTYHAPKLRDEVYFRILLLLLACCLDVTVVRIRLSDDIAQAVQRALRQYQTLDAAIDSQLCFALEHVRPVECGGTNGVAGAVEERERARICNLLRKTIKTTTKP